VSDPFCVCEARRQLGFPDALDPRLDAMLRRADARINHAGGELFDRRTIAAIILLWEETGGPQQPPSDSEP
jgi:hypothetical protein